MDIQKENNFCFISPKNNISTEVVNNNSNIINNINDNVENLNAYQHYSSSNDFFDKPLSDDDAFYHGTFDDFFTV